MLDGRTAVDSPVAAMSFAGLALDRPRLMGIVNVTPDSFSDGGECLDPDRAVARGLALIGQGADIVDVGGESTRPGAVPVPVDEELSRVVPVVRGLAAAGALVSIDTRHPEVMEAAIDAGARIINDVTALTGDRRSIDVVGRRGVSIVLMHMRGDPRTMQIEPRYEDVAGEIALWLGGRLAACESQGIQRDRIAVDPGIGFGKTVEHNLGILARLRLLRELGCALLVGVSRKSFIARVSRGEEPKDRLTGSIAAGLWAVAGGAHILRVHDVAETRQAIAVWRALAAEAEAADGCVRR